MSDDVEAALARADVDAAMSLSGRVLAILEPVAEADVAVAISAALAAARALARRAGMTAADLADMVLDGG